LPFSFFLFPFSFFLYKAMNSEHNGYLDPGQTIINYAVRELGMSFKDLVADDPSLLLRNWFKCYRHARNTVIGTGIAGAIAILLAVGTGATPLLVAGVLVAGCSCVAVKQQNAGVQSCELESEILDEIRPVLKLFVQLEETGEVGASDLVGVYDRLIKRISANPMLAHTLTGGEGLKAFLEAELRKCTLLSHVASDRSQQELSPLLVGDSPNQSNWDEAAWSEEESNPFGDAPEDSIATEPVIPKTDIAPSRKPLKSYSSLPPVVNLIAYGAGTYLRSMLYVGASGSGKSLLASTVSQQLRRNPKPQWAGIQVWLISAKDSESESTYWTHCDRRDQCHFLAASRREKYNAYARWLEVLEEFKYLKVPRILIVDELSEIGAQALEGPRDSQPYLFWQELKSYMHTVSSTARSSNIALWGIAPVAYCNRLGINRADISTYYPVFVGEVPPQWNKQVAAPITSNLAIEQPTDDDFYQARRDGCERVVYFMGQWHPLPALPVPQEVRQPQVVAPKEMLERSYPLDQPVEREERSLFDDLAGEQYPGLPYMAALILWLKNRQGKIIDKRKDILQSFGKNRSLTSNEVIQPYLEEAISLGLLTETEGGYQVLSC
jgi:hypothetical protein